MAMVHTAAALPAILAAAEGRFGGLAVLPVHPRAGEPAIRVVVTGRKASRAPLTLLPPLVLHDEVGAFTPRAAAILRNGAAITD
jgi:tRNA1(Val) A37 N6-methylase TrmN6